MRLCVQIIRICEQAAGDSLHTHTTHHMQRRRRNFQNFYFLFEYLRTSDCAEFGRADSPEKNNRTARTDHLIIISCVLKVTSVLRLMYIDSYVMSMQIH